MKICPTCKKTYTDESLNFCLEDGAVLNQFSEDDNSQPTVFMGQPPSTNPQSAAHQTVANPLFPNQSVSNQQVPNPAFPPVNRGLSHTVAPQQPVKKSNTWVWVLGIVGAVVVLGGLGFIGLIALIASNIPDESVDNPNTNIKVDPSSTPIVFKNIVKDDFSKWRTDSNTFGTTEYRGGEYIMSSKQVSYYYVLISADNNFKTSEGAIKVTLRNVNGTATNLGYGLLIHSEMKNPLVKDYGFLIDSSKQSYRVVQHTNKNESTLVNWTRFPSIRSGTQTNEIEIKDVSGKMSFYINGQFATSVDDSVKYKDGVFGLYVSDAIPIAFSNLQIGK